MTTPLSGIYRQGRKFEYRVATYFKRGGWVVIRSAGSHTPVDLVCAKGGEVRCVQCKAGVADLSPAEKEGLLAVAMEFGGTAWVAARDVSGHILMTELEG